VVELLPLGVLVAAEPLPLALPPDGAVELLGLVVVDEDEPVVVSDERGVVAVPGDADGLVRSGTVPTRSVSARLHAIMPPASARAQSPDSNFFIADAPPVVGWFETPHRKGATDMPVVRSAP
jgi:hypothetical protein